jgi:hypothetical protein
LAVEIARINHILPENSTCWEIQSEEEATLATTEDLINLQRWKEELENKMRQEFNSRQMQHDHTHHFQTYSPDVIPFEELLHANVEGGCLSSTKEQKMDDYSLNNEQRQVFDIVNRHLEETMTGKNPSQLRMIIPGEGGTGKSHTIQAITNNFKQRGVYNWLAKGAYTGIAASIIDGSTLHVLTAMPIRGSRSAQTMKKLGEFWKDKKYLIIDEMSMLSREFFAKLSKILTIVVAKDDEDKKHLPFGGLNIILVDDFHQFPPVVCRRSAPLFYPNDQRFDKTEDMIGREIYEQFKIVIRLIKQVRVEDPIWQDVLRHVPSANQGNSGLAM